MSLESAYQKIVWLGTSWAAVSAGILVFFDKAQKISTPEMKTSLASWLTTPTWSPRRLFAPFAAAYDAAFGPTFLSWRNFISVNVAAAVLFGAVVAVSLAHESQSMTLLQLFRWFVVISIASSVSDWVAAGYCRLVMGILSKEHDVQGSLVVVLPTMVILSIAVLSTLSIGISLVAAIIYWSFRLLRG